jgi:hypothetical protein
MLNMALTVNKKHIFFAGGLWRNQVEMSLQLFVDAFHSARLSRWVRSINLTIPFMINNLHFNMLSPLPAHNNRLLKRD